MGLFKFETKIGWTMAEMMIALAVLSVLTVLSIQTIKTQDVTSKPFAYAAIKNLKLAANRAMEELDESKLSARLVTNDGLRDAGGSIDEGCRLIGESLNLMGYYNCTRANMNYPGAPNFTTANGISYYGVAAAYVNGQRGEADDTFPDNIKAMRMKPIMVSFPDGNSSSGRNHSIGANDYPLLIYESGEVIPGSCNEIRFNGLVHVPGNPACSGTNYMLSDFPFSYNIYASDPDGEPVSGIQRRTSHLIATGLSFAEADCKARTNILTRATCNSFGYAVLDDCKRINDHRQRVCIIRQERPVGVPMFGTRY